VDACQQHALSHASGLACQARVSGVGGFVSFFCMEELIFYYLASNDLPFDLGDAPEEENGFAISQFKDINIVEWLAILRKSPTYE